MAKTTSLIYHLDQILPDSKIEKDLSGLLRENNTNGEAVIELDGAEVYVPYDVNTKVVTKALFKDNYNSGFGIIRTQLAIGDITNPTDGIAVAEFCFATLYYDEDCNLITADFHRLLR